MRSFFAMSQQRPGEKTGDAPHRPAQSRAMRILGWLAGHFRRLFSIDTRSLAALRIGLGTILLLDLVVRSRDLEAHYSDFGLLPTWATVPELQRSWHLSVHMLSGHWAWQAFLFLLAAAFAVALIVGWRTRLVAVASWLLLCSLHARNPMVLNSGDVLLRMMLFWGLFLPLGARWSLDARRDPGGPPRQQVFSAATVGAMLQLLFVYIFTALLKSDPLWTESYWAAYYALSFDHFTTPLGYTLLEHPDLLRFLAMGTIWLEWIGPFLLFVPWFTPQIRVVVALAFVAMHASFALSMQLGFFSFICIVSWSVFLPGWFWDKLRAVRSWFARRAEAAAAAPQKQAHYTSGAPRWLRWSGNTLGAFLVAYIFLWNLRTLDRERYGPLLPKRMNVVGNVLRLDQYWGMFSPRPPDDGGWFVVMATLEDGSRVDLFADGRDVRWDKPGLVSAMYPCQRWRKYMLNLRRQEYKTHRPYYAEYLYRLWNREHEPSRHVDRIDLYYMREKTLAYPDSAEVEKVLVYDDDFVWPPAPPPDPADRKAVDRAADDEPDVEKPEAGAAPSASLPGDPASQ